MDKQPPQPDTNPYTDADIAAIIAAPLVPMISNMNPFFEARLQYFAEVVAESKGGKPDAGSWTWELAQLFGQTFKQEHAEPFVRFYREASRRLIESAYVRDKGIDPGYLLFKMQQGKSAELSDDTILDTLRQQREQAESA
jgi:hypothetical protein